MYFKIVILVRTSVVVSVPCHLLLFNSVLTVVTLPVLLPAAHLLVCWKYSQHKVVHPILEIQDQDVLSSFLIANIGGI